MNKPSGTAIGLAAALASLVLWTVAPLFVKTLTTSFDPWSQNLFRYLVAACTLAPWLAAGTKRGMIGRGVWLRSIVPAVFNIAMQCLWALSLYYLNPGFVALLTQTAVLWVAVLSIILFAEDRPLLYRPAFWGGLAMALVGVGGVIMLGRDFNVEGVPKGMAIACGSAFLWALYTVAVRMTFHKTPSHYGFAVMSLYTVIGLAAVWCVLSDPADLLCAGPGAWLMVVVSGMVCIVGSHISYYVAIKRLGPTLPSVILLGLPFTVLFPSMLLFDEAPVPAQWGCGVVLVAGLCIATLAKARKGGLQRS